jgi:hypothetical protein
VWSQIFLTTAETLVAIVERVFNGLLKLAIGVSVVVAITVVPLGYFGAFGQTGADYFRDCWEKSVASGAQPPTARQALAWAKCEPAAGRAAYGAGLIFVSLDADGEGPEQPTLDGLVNLRGCHAGGPGRPRRRCRHERASWPGSFLCWNEPLQLSRQQARARQQRCSPGRSQRKLANRR